VNDFEIVEVEPLERSRMAASLKYQLFIMACSLAYGGMLVMLPIDAFKDRGNYLAYAEISWEILLGYWSKSFMVGLFNEPVWLLANAGLAEFFTPEVVLRLLLFVPAIIVAFLVLRDRPQDFVWLLLFLFIPQVMNNHIVHVRQGVAVAVFLIGWFGKSEWQRTMLMSLAAFIHSSFFFVVILWFAYRLMFGLRYAWDMRGMLFAGIGLGLGLGLGKIAEFLGARQADSYDSSMLDISGLAFVFWMCLLIVMIMEGRRYVRRYAFEFGVVIFYLCTYFLTAVTGRIFECVMIPVLLAMLDLTSWRRWVFLSMVCFYTVLQYAMRYQQPLLGF
jgi:hypothetical protein